MSSANNLCTALLHSYDGKLAFNAGRAAGYPQLKIVRNEKTTINVIMKKALDCDDLFFLDHGMNFAEEKTIWACW